MAEYFQRKNPKRQNSLEAEQVSELREASQSLSTALACNEPDTSKWRQASFIDICHCEKVGLSNEMERAGADALLNNDVARQAVWKFITFGGSSSPETSLSALIRFDTLNTDAIDGPATYLGKLQDTVVSEQDFELKPASGAGVQAKIANRADAVAQESSRILKHLLLVAVVNVLTECYQTLCWNDLKECSGAAQEMAVSSTATVINQIENGSREQTICFQMPDKGH